MNLRIKDHHKTRPSPSPEQEQLRKEIAFQTACYLAKGGEIKQLPVEASGVK